VITAGQANGASPHSSGGGMYNDSGSPTLANVTFSGNYATDFGGGMQSDFGSPTLTNVTFSGNSAGYSGGGMENFCGSSTLMNITFSGNSASRGGGMYNSGVYGGGNATLTNVTFYSNTATDGGGMYNNLSYPELTNALFYSNSATDGGGIYNGGTMSVLTNVTFFGNRATSSGGGIYNRQHEYYYVDSETTIANSIVWDNGFLAIYNDSTSVISVTYSLVEGGWSGEGNINADPLFVDAASGNLRLQAGSPAIDAGNDAAVPPGITTDLDGNPRFDYIVDMGAYEYQDNVPGPRPFGKSLPLNGNTSQPLTITLSWRASPLANSYAYCYDTTNNNACDATWVTTSQTSAQISGLSQGVTYYWQVRAVNNEGTEYANGGTWWSFTTAPSRPGLFGKLAPPNGIPRALLTPTLSWSDSPGVERYEYCYDTSNDSACSPWVSAGTSTSVTLPSLLPDTTYYWQVRAVNGYGTTYANGSSTDFWSFTTYHLPGAFNKT
ncbi:choice-of-anchor Q domain-containing protein, partial [Chloroflexus sp.]|uniref:choice-of-anchor Q domain-containing protein n=1 Tax=Chloroflexus sp. TaxID=1904827 RepID=UPI003C718B92